MKLTTPQPARHPNPTTKATALAYLMFDRPDLDQAEHFLTDCGLRRVRVTCSRSRHSCCCRSDRGSTRPTRAGSAGSRVRSR